MKRNESTRFSEVVIFGSLAGILALLIILFLTSCSKDELVTPQEIHFTIEKSVNESGEVYWELFPISGGFVPGQIYYFNELRLREPLCFEPPRMELSTVMLEAPDRSFVFRKAKKGDVVTLKVIHPDKNFWEETIQKTSLE